MSKGPGRIERSIAALMENNPHGAFSTAELCRRLYPVDRWRPEKKHRVAVVRAMWRLAEKSRDWRVLHGDGAGGELHIYNAASVASGKARLRLKRPVSVRALLPDSG